MEFKITTRHPASSYGMPICLIDGQLVDSCHGFKGIQKKLELTNFELGEFLNRSSRAVDEYRSGKRTIPAEVWLMLDDMLHHREPDDVYVDGEYRDEM